ncbi:hypothetical protein Q5O24_06510 [Eubacteriaceae bacterium ES3]|nr:hypothetical protein Q5O24_06510 [Eubacteriaceae bacterium ES3]
MKTLLDGIQNVGQSEAVNELAELATFNTDTYIKVLFYNIKRIIITFLALFFPKLEEKSDSLKPDSVQQRYEKKQIEYSDYSMSALKEEYKRLLTKAVRGNDFQSDDELLASVTQKSSRILSKNEIKGKSVYEINDLLFQKYPNLTKPDFENLLLGTILCEALLLLALLLAIVYWNLPALLLIGIFFAIQPLIYSLIRARLSTWKLARFVWLAASGAGGFNESKGKLPLDLINNTTRQKMLLDVRTIHNLWKSVNNMAAENDDIKQRITAIERQIISNNKIMTDNNSAKKNSDSFRIIEDKKIENKSLTEEKTDLQQSLENKTLDLKKYQQLLNFIETDTSNTIIGMWKKIFCNAEFSQDFVFDLIRKFSLADFSLVEKRIFEVCNTTSPKSLAKRITGGYSLSFLTSTMDLATMTFSLNHSSTPTFFKIDRAVALQETQLSREELQQVISIYENSGSDKNKDLLTEYEVQIMELHKQQNIWDLERQKIKDEATDFENQKEKLLSDIKFSYDKIDDLQNQIVAKEKDCEVLQKQLEKTTTSDELSKSLAEQTEELRKLESNYEVKIDENDKLLEDLEYVNEQKEKLLQLCDKQDDEINEHQQINSEFKNELESKKLEINNKEQEHKQKSLDIYLKSRLLEKMKTNKIKDKEITQNLKNDITLLKKEKKELEESIQTQIRNISTIEEDLLKYENFFSVEKAKVVKLRKELEGIKAKLLTNQDFDDELYRQIEAARKYIYIVDPILDDRQFNNLLNNLGTAMSNYPDLKVRLLYGMKVRPGKDHEEDMYASEAEFKKASKLELRLGRNAITKRGNTYAKVMLFDDKSFILSRTNVISAGENYRNEAEIDDKAKDETTTAETAKDIASIDEASLNEVSLFSTDVRICQQLKKQYFDW